MTRLICRTNVPAKKLEQEEEDDFVVIKESHPNVSLLSCISHDLTLQLSELEADGEHGMSLF